MNKSAPAPTKTFPDKRPPYVRWSFYLLCLCLILLMAGAAGLVFWYLQDTRGSHQGNMSGMRGELRRDLAGKLLSAGLTEKALEQYQLYLSETDLSAQRRANMAFTIGKLYMEMGRYEDALNWLFRVEMLDPKSELAPEVGSKIVACLERLGRYAQAQYSLDARSSPDERKVDEFKDQQIVARIGKQTISLEELDQAIDAMPEWMRQSMNDPSRKEAFLQQYVAEELLYRKAKKLEFDQDPLVRRQAEQALRQLLVQKVLEQEIQDRVKISPEDVELYYRANKINYQEKEAFKINLIKVPEGRLAELQDALKKGEKTFPELALRFSVDRATKDRGGEVSEWIEVGTDPTGMGDPERLWESIRSLSKGEMTAPAKVDDSYYLFQVVSHRPERTPDYDKVKEQAGQDMYQERFQKAYQDLIQQALLVSDVKIYPEGLRGSKPPDSDSQ